MEEREDIWWIDAKTIVTRTKSTEWFGYRYNMNIYRGCCHDCIYCDSRSECYQIDCFDRVRVKKDALRIIRDDLRRKVQPGVVGTGAMSDPYNPLEEKLGYTRHALELLSAYGFGVGIATKSPLITRDIDLLSEIKNHSPVLCKITITTADDTLAEKIEPHVAPSSQRFEAVGALASAGLFAGVILMPVLPFLEDTPENLLAIVERAADAGARFIYPAFGMTLRDRQRLYYFERLEALFPGRKLSERYRAQYGNSYRCVSPRAAELWQVFDMACAEKGLLTSMPDITACYKTGYGSEQLRFF